jgi:hypothetical protein
VPAARGSDYNGRRQFAVLALEFLQLGFGVGAINVYHEDARDRAGGNRNIEVGVATPPLLDRAGVNGGALEAIGCRWSLVTRPARKNMQAACS